MSKAFVGIAAILWFLSANPAAQGEAQQPRLPPKPAEAQKPAPQENVVRPPAPQGQPTNVRLDMTITDQTGTGEAAKRTVTMIVADGQSGSIRSTGNQVQARLFVDATPHILSGGKVRVHLAVEYNPRQTAEEVPEVLMPGPRPIGGSSLHQRITVVLEPGKPMVISQAWDPVSDRNIAVELGASILK
jgi:hypothetical protein